MNNYQVTSHATATAIENYISNNIVNKYQEDLSRIEDFKQIIPSLTRFQNRSREFHKPSFVVLVVGPVKSGKSTFVNLVANNYVSPTHFLECTVRPSIISAGIKKELTIYRSLNRDGKKEQMDDILDCLNGLIERDNVSDVSTNTVSLTDENIDKYVRLDLCGVENDEILLTSITTDGGKLLQDNVFLVDMAGFDGANVSLDTPAYQSVIERADLIIFVQSSNSAISKVSSTFFDIMKSRNTSAPICLIHNIFESAYWRSEELREKEIEEQKEYAIEAIREKYKLTLEENNSFNLNLGKVNDLRKNNYEPGTEDILKAEELKFIDAESKMYELFSRRGTIRLRNCISRTAIQQKNLLDQIDSIITKYQERQGKYDSTIQDFDKLKISQNDIQFASNSTINIDDLHSIVTSAYNKIRHDINGMGEFKTKKGKPVLVIKISWGKATELARNFLNIIKDNLNKYLNERIQLHKSLLETEQIKKIISTINVRAAQYNINSFAKVESQVKECTLKFEHKINIEELLPKKIFNMKYDGETVIEKLTYIKEKLNGFTKADVHEKGYIEEKAYLEICQMVDEARKDYIEDIISTINNELERLKNTALSGIIPDMEVFENNFNLIRELRKDIENLNIPTT